MKYIDEFRDKKLVLRFSKKIKEIMPKANLNLMEVCGTHTQGFYRFGLDKLLPENLRLISGPGCPVCVSAQEYIDDAIAISRQSDAVILTFGDMLRIPGTISTLEKEKAKSGNVRVVYSPLDAITVAKLNPDKRVVFLAVGFETTIPAIALTIILARQEKLKNLFFLTALKLIPPAMDFLVCDGLLKLDGFLCPGHVSAIIGTKPYEFIVKKHKIACCVAGFEPLDIMEGLYMLVRQIQDKKPAVANQYTRVVTNDGNPRARKIITKVFTISDVSWRGLGVIPKSGLKINEVFSNFDAEREFSLTHKSKGKQEKTKCRCGEVLKGIVRADLCPLFKKACTPEHPVGPCMVTSEGACNVYYKYAKR